LIGGGNGLGYSIIIPTYNEDLALRNTVTDLQKTVSGLDCEIIVVDDGSIDTTQEVLKKINNINVVTHQYNKGYGAALKTGIKNSKNEFVVFYDADGQHRPQDLILLIRNLGTYDLLIGKREKTSHQSFIRKPGKWLLSVVANFLTSRKIPDLNSGLRIIKTDIIKKILHLMPDGFSFTTTSTIAMYNLGYNVGYYPITVNKRIGKSTVRQFKHGTKTILLIIRLIVLFNPLRIFMPVSIFLILLGSIYEIIYGIILYDHGFKLLAGAVLCVLSGINIFFFSLVIDQISEMRKQPLDK
jgi:glycosyltransferase involved in cell wall biosynthesis